MIYFVRHGVTDWNENKDENGNINARCQGRADIPLNKNGIKQAEELADALKDIKFDKVICSPLTRTKQTCEIILGSLDGVVFDERVIERDFGEFEGLTRNEFDFDNFCNEFGNQKFEKAEPINAFEKRVYHLLKELEYESEKNILIVAHGGVGFMYLTYFDGKPENNNYEKYIIPHGRPIIRDFKNKQKTLAQ